MEKRENKEDNETKTGENNPQERILSIEHLKKSFNGNEVLKDISLQLSHGENLVIMGKSGTGKSVLIKCIVRLLDADEGTIMLFGKNVPGLNQDELNALRKEIGFLFQSAALYDSMTVEENLEFQLRNSNKTGEEVQELVRQSLESVGLADTAKKMPSELSGGMRKRIGLARTLILRPQIVLYDEPNTGLDPITTREISHLIVDLQKKHQTSSIIITHDAECARITGDRIMIIDRGLCVAGGSYEELKKSDNEWVRSFFTNHENNHP